MTAAYLTKAEKTDLCDCGAKFTSFPDHHSDWCSVNHPFRDDVPIDEYLTTLGTLESLSFEDFEEEEII